MPIKEHPPTGTILMCNFNSGFVEPEMVKRRPVVVLSPKIAARPGLCTVVALSTTEPRPALPYHCQIDILPELPAGFKSKGIWVKGDMINAVGLHRLDFIRTGSTANGKRTYHYQPLSDANIKRIRGCVLAAIGLSTLTKHLP
ncbi:MAG: type II toxin-antitoxin system PemK/MazF family toxin [Hyphomicrobium sp.]|nr:type II toxin-antitoxin system PemK/MazF family toxin [Hyphomicrobium sp.]